MKEPNKIESLAQCGIGPASPKAKRFMKKQRSRQLRRYAKVDTENLKPKALYRGWYW